MVVINLIVVYAQGGSLQAQNYGAPAAAMNQAPASGSAGAAAAQPRPRVRARRGQATDPHSIAERVRHQFTVFSRCFFSDQPNKTEQKH